MSDHKCGTTMVLANIFHRKPAPDIAGQLYLRLVEHARLPGFFRDGGVPDTVDGRFDMVVLHAFLVLRRLSGPLASAPEAELAQNLFDLMFADMDRNLREMGVGDLSVGGKIRAMIEAFYGRVAAYEAGLAAGEDAALTDALARNLYRGGTPDPTQLARMAAYVRREALGLAAQSSSGLLSGELGFGMPMFIAGD